MVSKDIVHRDLKPQNILLSHEGRTRNPHPQDIKLKIADFGFARFLQDGVMAATLCGSPMYMAPEVIMSLQYNSKADLWSLGTIVFQCLTGKAPFQAQTPQALKHYYEKNANLAPRIPSGTSPELTNLLLGLLKRNAADRLDFEAFFNHAFIRPPPPLNPPCPPPPPPQNTGPVAIARKASGGATPQATPSAGTSASSTPKCATTPTRAMAIAGSPGIPGVLPPSPGLGHGFSTSPTKRHPAPQPMEESGNVKKQESSPDEHEDFVMVPTTMTMDAAEVRKTRREIYAAQVRGGGSSRRHTVTGPQTRPTNLPMAAGPNTEPIPVPTQKAAYQQIQESLVRSRSRSGDSVSAMSGVSSTSDTVGPLPTDGAVVKKKQSAPPIPDICQLSPPTVQFTMPTNVPTTSVAHRRRTSSSSSCGTPPPNVQWQISPNSPIVGGAFGGRMTPTLTSPVRRAGMGSGPPIANPNGQQNNPTLSPILGSPNKVDDTSFTRASTVPEGLSGKSGSPSLETVDERRRSATEMQLVASGRKIALNYGSQAPHFDRSSKI